ncbi:hypothetical protein GCM10009780_09940 [Actinomadura alba]
MTVAITRHAARRSRRATVAVAAVLLLCVPVIGGCSAEDRPRRVPSGFTSYRGDGYAFAYPQGWTVRRDKDRLGHPMVLVDGPQIRPGVSQGQIRVSTERPARLSFGDQLGQYRALSAITGRRVRVDRAVKVAGAERAHRFEGLYTIGVDAGETSQMEVIDLYVRTEDGAHLDFVVRAPEGGIAATRLSEALMSLRVTEGGG